MTGPSISERAKGAVSSIDTFMRACHPYRPIERVPASIADVREVAEILLDLARAVEANHASILLAHQGPFFNGTESHCLCGHPVQSAEEWAAHVNQKLEDGAA